MFFFCVERLGALPVGKYQRNNFSPVGPPSEKGAAEKKALLLYFGNKVLMRPEERDEKKTPFLFPSSTFFTSMPKEKGKRRRRMRSMTGAAPLILNTFTITFLCRKIQDSLELSPTSSHLWLLPSFLSSFPPFLPLVFSINQSRVEGGEEQRQEKKKK